MRQKSSHFTASSRFICFLLSFLMVFAIFGTTVLAETTTSPAAVAQSSDASGDAEGGSSSGPAGSIKGAAQTLTLQTDLAGKTFTVAGNAYTAPVGVEENSQPIISVTPDTGFIGWYDAAPGILVSAEPTFKYTMPSAATTLVAVFDEASLIDVSVTCNPGNRNGKPGQQG